MLTLYQIQHLKIQDQVYYTPWQSSPLLCSVIYNGARQDVNGNNVPGMPPVLTLQIGEGPTTISWGYDGLNNGLTELSL
jgi:hypothetical protein